MTLSLKISRNDSDRVVRAECRVREADVPGVLSALNATADDAYFSIGAGLEKFAVPCVGFAYQNRSSSGVNQRLDWERFAKFEA